jgi:hypothetical protein
MKLGLKEKDEKPWCANGNGDPTANYRGCLFHPNNGPLRKIGRINNKENIRV